MTAFLLSEILAMSNCISYVLFAIWCISVAEIQMIQRKNVANKIFYCYKVSLLQYLLIQYSSYKVYNIKT